MKISEYENKITQYTKEFTAFLDARLRLLNCPEPLLSSMKYSLSAGGKRLRPVLFRLAHDIYSPFNRNAGLFAFAIECIHTYSLIHDDLPSIDNDDYRRGKLSNHKVFGEDIALLAGDGLLNYAYELIGEVLLDNPSVNNIKAFSELASASGINGMIGGQVADVTAEKPGSVKNTEVLEYIHLNKTARLLTAALVCGALMGGATDADIKIIREYGENLGMLFQITDDVLDVKGCFEVVGKTLDKDGDKLTYPGLLGLEESYKKAAQFRDAAASAIAKIPDSGIFIYICDMIYMRNK